MENAPILLFTYNRPKHTEATIISLLKNDLAPKSEIIIYSDGPKNDKDEKEVTEVRNYIHSITGFLKITIIEQKYNKGLANSIIEGVTYQINKYNKVIVLEDDLLLAPYFLTFMNDALNIYENVSNVGHIHGCNFFQQDFPNDTFFIKWVGSWGWGTWKRAWKLFNPDGKKLLAEIKERSLMIGFNINNSYNYINMLKNQIEGKNNSWAIRWYASLFINDLLAINAGKSLVKNIGFDGSGTHCNETDIYSTFLYHDKISIPHTLKPQEDINARKMIETYYRRNHSLKAKILRKIKKAISHLWKMH